MAPWKSPRMSGIFRTRMTQYPGPEQEKKFENFDQKNLKEHDLIQGQDYYVIFFNKMSSKKLAKMRAGCTT
ncbi:MAG: hypothetical protein ACLFUS_13560 [Candidatus Sumerlaeia bacterium]